LRPCSASSPLLRTSSLNPSTSLYRLFSNTPIYAGTWLLPTQPEKKRSRKGRPRVPTGGSSRGTTVVWGDYGLRMCDHHRRVSASQLKNGEDAIKNRLRGMRYRLYTRICANIGVYTSGNEVRFPALLP
jgi:Ribosomal protein L16p/L10e